MAGYDYDLGIIGGGAAGLTVASGAAQLGAKTLLIEKEPHLGGDCLHYGCVPSKTLIKSAQVYHLIKTASAYGLPRVQPPVVDLSRIVARIKDVIANIQKHDSVKRFCNLGVQVEFGSAAFIDEHKVEMEGKTYSAGRWLIATGSSPSAPPLPGLDQTPFLTNKELFSLESLPESMIVVGAGPIAIEMAQAFGRLGTKVMVVQRSGQILSKEDKNMADVVMEALKKEGVEFHLGTDLRQARPVGSQAEVTFIDSVGQEVRLRADKLLVALGRKANLEGLGLEAAGVKYSPKGLEVDNRLRTTQKHIFGAGDVTGSYQFTHAAGYEGGVVLANAVFRLPRRVDYTYMPWCTYSSPELASIGMNEKTAQKAGIKHKLWIEEFKDNDRSLAEGQRSGRLKMLVDKDEKPLGVQIVGLHAGELLNEWVAVLSGKVKTATLAAAVHPYPTLGEINKRVAGDILAPKLFSKKVQKGLKFFFHLKGRACQTESG
ncbi:MAG: FAD-dependent oxidoreductase [Desulfarculaceae bacterium]|jgi:pyruvate/2-oxoglutarate dehydrogenase complex dihydrolipoamide dehydrogenase (E3) component